MRVCVCLRGALHLVHVQCVCVCVRDAPDIREFSQIGNVDVRVNVDVQSHPVGCSTPQTLFNSISHCALNSALSYQNKGMYEEK